MQFSDTTGMQGLIQDCEFFVFGGDYGAISDNTRLLQEFTRLLNEGLNKSTIKIMNSDTRWQWDDPNHTDYPVATSALVAGQKDYVLEFSATDSHLKIDRVEIKTSGGLWKKLDPIDITDMEQAEGEFYKTDGEPQYYDKRANTVTLYPAPNYSQAASIKVFYQREPSYFVYTDTVKRPGIPTPFHRLITLYACEDFTVSKEMEDKSKQISIRRQEMESELENFYNKRDKEDKPRIKPLRVNYR